MKWYLKSAAQGNTRAQNNIGCHYQNGLGVQQDYSKAHMWYERAAKRGDPNSQEGLGELYENGWGVPKSLPRAIGWYRKAADQGNKTAIKKLEGFKKAVK